MIKITANVSKAKNTLETAEELFDFLRGRSCNANAIYADYTTSKIFPIFRHDEVPHLYAEYTKEVKDVLALFTKLSGIDYALPIITVDPKLKDAGYLMFNGCDVDISYNTTAINKVIANPVIILGVDPLVHKQILPHEVLHYVRFATGLFDARSYGSCSGTYMIEEAAASFGAYAFDLIEEQKNPRLFKMHTMLPMYKLFLKRYERLAVNYTNEDNSIDTDPIIWDCDADYTVKDDKRKFLAIAGMSCAQDVEKFFETNRCMHVLFGPIDGPIRSTSDHVIASAIFMNNNMDPIQTLKDMLTLDVAALKAKMVLSREKHAGCIYDFEECLNFAFEDYMSPFYCGKTK